MFDLGFFLEKLQHFFLNAQIQIGLSVASVLVILALEIIVLGYKKSSTSNIVNGNAAGRRDLLSYVLDVTGALRIIGHVVTLGAGYLFGQFINKKLGINLTGGISNPVIQIGFFLLVKSFFDYWMHRLMHTSPVLWEIHKYHHSAIEMNVVTAHRESILVAPWSSLYFAIPLGILGAPVTTMIVTAFLIELHAVLIHSQFKFTFGRFGECFIISPFAHRIHHSDALVHRDKNFGFLFSFWDHLFGTYHMEKTDLVVVIGVDDPVYNHVSWPKEMVYCVKSFGLQLFKVLKRS